MPRPLTVLPPVCPSCGKANVAFKTRSSYIHHLRRHLLQSAAEDSRTAQQDMLHDMAAEAEALKEQLARKEKENQLLKDRYTASVGLYHIWEEAYKSEIQSWFVFRPGRLWDRIKALAKRRD